MSPRRNWDSPAPLTPASVSLPSELRGGTLAFVWGGGEVPIPTTGEKAYHSAYSVLQSLPRRCREWLAVETEKALTLSCPFNLLDPSSFSTLLTFFLLFLFFLFLLLHQPSFLVFFIFFSFSSSFYLLLFLLFFSSIFFFLFLPPPPLPILYPLLLLSSCSFFSSCTSFRVSSSSSSSPSFSRFLFLFYFICPYLFLPPLLLPPSLFPSSFHSQFFLLFIFLSLSSIDLFGFYNLLKADTEEKHIFDIESWSGVCHPLLL